MDPLIDRLRMFIAFRSVGQDADAKRECLEWIWEEFLSGSGLTPSRGAVQGSPYLFLPHLEPRMLWFGHVDVVPGSEGQFSLIVDGDRALGRGVKDMKGADLAFLTAFKEACARGPAPPVSVLLTSDEETGGHTPKQLVSQGSLGTIPVAFTPDTGEADGIVTELKGALWARLIAQGRGGHGAAPWRSRNPIPRLFDVVRELTERFPPGGNDDWQVTMSPTRLHGSDGVNVIPSEASCILDVRFPPETWKTPADALAALQKLIPPDCRLEEADNAYPTYCDPGHPLVQRMQRIAQDVIGGTVPIRREHGASDARFFTAAGIPAFLYGPVGGDLHGAHEWVSVPSLRQHVEINRRLLAELSGEAAGAEASARGKH